MALLKKLQVSLSFRAESNLSLFNSKRCLDFARHDRAAALSFQQREFEFNPGWEQ